MLDENGIDLHIIDMNISTKDAMGKMFFTMMSVFAELEANLLSERTKKGLEAARARGRKGGRPSLPDHKKREIKFLYDEQKFTGEQIAEKTGEVNLLFIELLNKKQIKEILTLFHFIYPLTYYIFNTYKGG